MGKVTFINAIISGKLEGTVYARNKAGYYIKGYTVPLDPRSIAQLQNRAWFSNAASSYHALTDIQKAAWNSFGNGIFIPKKGATASPLAGFNAYVAMSYTAQFGVNKARINVVTTPAVGTTTYSDFATTQVAPIAAISGMIKDNAGAPLPLHFTNASLVAATGLCTAELSFPITQLLQPQFVDSVLSEPVGFFIQISNPMTQVTQFVTNPRIRAVNIIKPITSMTTWATSPKIVLSASAADLSITNFKEWVVPGQIVEARCYIVSKFGQQKFIGAKMITIL